MNVTYDIHTEDMTAILALLEPALCVTTDEMEISVGRDKVTKKVLALVRQDFSNMLLHEDDFTFRSRKPRKSRPWAFELESLEGLLAGAIASVARNDQFTVVSGTDRNGSPFVTLNIGGRDIDAPANFVFRSLVANKFWQLDALPFWPSCALRDGSVAGGPIQYRMGYQGVGRDRGLGRVTEVVATGSTGFAARQ